jgi:Mg/Co/Ni transporter MgtE
VRDAMRTSFPIAHPGERLVDVQGRMRSAHIQAIPVVDKGGQLQGMLRSEDINEAYQIASSKFWPSDVLDSVHP